jgi:hypothetical protein
MEPMRRFAVLLILVFTFVAPLAVPAAQASESGALQARARDNSCRHRRAKKQSSESKPKKKDKDSKKPYGFEL